MEEVKKAVVGIAGLGGLGSNVAAALARTSVGKLVLADFDAVEPSNLNRQFYFTDQLGMKKTDALAANLKRINPLVSLEAHCVKLTPENIPAIFKGVDVMVEAFDGAAAKAMIAEVFGAAFPGVPLVMATGLAGYGSSNAILTRKMGESIYLCGDLESAVTPALGPMAPRVGIAAMHQANMVLRLLLGHREP